MDYRIDHDTMGKVRVPKEALYGAQTQRSLENFPIGDEKMPDVFIKTYALLKQAAAITNNRLKLLSDEKANLIIKASQEIIDGHHLDQFPLKIWQTGSGTQTNMNLNEVIANIANLMAKKNIGDNSPIHPNDDVNMCQSSNDTFPSAMHMVLAILVNNDLLPSIKNLIDTFNEKSIEYKDLIKMGLTHLQDATPLTLGQEMGSYVAQLASCYKAIENALPFIYELALGGTAVGTGLNSHPLYAELSANIIAEKTKLPFKSAKNKFAALSANDPCVLLSGALNMLACAGMKIANDIRWLSSGPRGGLYEISIAENEPGSSIMPGKVNPTQSEALTMVCCQVMGNHVAISIGCSQGNFELNVFKPLIIKNLLHSIRLLSDSLKSFDMRCAKTIKANINRITELRDRSLMLVTALTPYIGYEKAASVAKRAHKEGKTLKEVVLLEGLMSEQEFDERLNLKKMLGP